MCECFTIGGPFIGADPECPTHGTIAVERDRDIAVLADRVSGLEDRLEELSGASSVS